MSGPRKARGRDVASRVREAFLKALDNLRDSPGGVIELSEILQECLTADPLKTLDTVSKFIPRELMVEEETTVRIISGEPLNIDEWEREHITGESVEVERTH